MFDLHLIVDPLYAGMKTYRKRCGTRRYDFTDIARMEFKDAFAVQSQVTPWVSETPTQDMRDLATAFEMYLWRSGKYNPNPMYLNTTDDVVSYLEDYLSKAREFHAKVDS